MKFLVDRCAGRRLAVWLRDHGHDVREVEAGPPDPSDAELLHIAHNESRILITLDSDFGALVYLGGAGHHGIVRLPDVPAAERIALMTVVLERHSEAELAQAVVTIKGNRIRVSRTSRRL